MKILYGQDGESFAPSLERQFDFSEGDIKYLKKDRKKVFDFVGFITSNNETLAVFPKHYFPQYQEIARNNHCFPGSYDANLLFKVISTYMQENLNRRAQSDKYFGDQKEYDSDYPFSSFFEIYDYYRKYGLYYEDEVIVSRGQHGKISWKDTIRKSNILISNGNIIFSPLYSKSMNQKTHFISECMAFVINHTIKTFPFFLHMQCVGGFVPNFDYMANSTYVLKQLYRYRNFVFKDIHQKLVSSLITFFEELKQKKHGGNVYVKISFFDRIWERMVEKYLNHYFAGVDPTSGEIFFDTSQETSSVRFVDKTFVVDDSPNAFKIRLDHYGLKDDKQYIFDSKYYYEVSELNYKQFAYDVLLQSLNQNSNTYNVLILPGPPHSSIHLDVKLDYRCPTLLNHRIIEQYLDVKTIMEHYVAEQDHTI